MKKSKFTVAITLLLMGITLACTIPVYFASAPEGEEKIVYVEITSTPEDKSEDEVMEEAEETEQEATATVSVNLDGPWTIWQGSDEQELSIDFLQQGFDLIGNAATGDGHSIMFKGVIGEEGKSIAGTWDSTTGTSGNFTIELNDSLNSFSGNLGGGVPFCGTRMGSSKPYPCIK